MDAIKPAELNEQDQAKVIDFLRNHPVGTLATVSPQGEPDASVVYFGVRDNLDVTFTTKQRTQKRQNISHTNKVKLVVFDAVTQTQIQLSGRAIEQSDQEVAHEIFQGTILAAAATGPDNVPPIAKLSAGDYVAYVIKLEGVKTTGYGWGDNFAKALRHANDEPVPGDPA